MDFKIIDSTGTEQGAKVFDDNRLSIKGVTVSEQELEALRGRSFQVGSGVVNLTSASESAVLYFKNNEDEDVLLKAVNITSTGFTGSSAGVMLAKLYVKGTGLSSSTAQSALNNNFGSSIELDANIQAGAEGASVTNGVVAGAFYIPVETFFNTDIAWVLPKGSSVAITFTPATGNTSFNCTVTLEAVIVGEY